MCAGGHSAKDENCHFIAPYLEDCEPEADVLLSNIIFHLPWELSAW